MHVPFTPTVLLVLVACGSPGPGRPAGPSDAGAIASSLPGDAASPARARHAGVPADEPAAARAPGDRAAGPPPRLAQHQATGHRARGPRRPDPGDDRGQAARRVRAILGEAPPVRAVGPRPDPPPVPADAGPFVYDHEELRSGDIAHVLHGSGPLWNPEEHDAYRRAFARQSPYLVRFGISLAPSQRFGFGERLAIVERHFRDYADQVPVFTIKFDENHPDGTGTGLDREVNRGLFDDDIRALGRLVASAGRPVFVRIGPEVNGPWNGYHPDAFPQAFRRIAGLLAEAGADNVITVWNVKALRDGDRPHTDWYPGDDVVDWWSIDLFTEDFTSPLINARVRAFLADAAARGKPVMIPESCPNRLDLDDPATWDRWFVPYLDLIASDPNIKAFCYSNRDFATWDRNLADWGDMRLDRSRLARRWRIALEQPWILHQQRPLEGEGGGRRDAGS